MNTFIKFFREIGINDTNIVGGKNASLGEMFHYLSPMGIRIPDGFALTIDAYQLFLERNNISLKLSEKLAQLDHRQFSNLHEIGEYCRKLILEGKFPPEVIKSIREGYDTLVEKYGNLISLAARSSATAEDLQGASFAGQQETYLNIQNLEELIKACHFCFASLFTDRAIKYRVDKGFDHMKVSLSVGIQLMIRSDLAGSGVLFTLHPDTGFENMILISGAWGLGENIVKGTINTDEFIVYKPFLGKSKQPIISKKMGSKLKMMVYSPNKNVIHPNEAVMNLDTPIDLQKKFSLNDDEILTLANWAVSIQKHYQCHMDIEWAKDGISQQLYILQARPETVFNLKPEIGIFKEYTLKKRNTILCKGIGLGNRIVYGKARILHSADDMAKLEEGEILVTEKTDPDWDPILKKASAIITDQGGRTSHAAIVARELGAIAIVGTTNATKTIMNGQMISISTAEGDTGFVYDGKIDWVEKEINLSQLKMPKTKVMLILGHPDKALKYARLPNDGVGLMRMEFIINSAIMIHPMALKHFEKIKDDKTKKQIETLTYYYKNKEQYFIDKLAEATASIAAAFYPKPVIVRMSDFKSNEYAHLLGGLEFEPKEENPMIGFRGASRYYHPLYQEGFEMECKAMKKVREEMGFTNIKLMIPFCRTVTEAKKVSDLMDHNGLKRKQNGLELYMMVEIPSNALQAEEFAKYFDGFSIGSNDLTQLTLGADRDSELLKDIFSPFEPSVMQLIKMAISKAKIAGIKIGLCGQAPSDYPEYAQFLVQSGIDSISFNPDALIKGIENIQQSETLLKNRAETEINAIHDLDL